MPAPAVKSLSTTFYQKGQVISFDGRTVSFDDVYLVKLRRASKGSWQPEYMVMQSALVLAL